MCMCMCVCACAWFSVYVPSYVCCCIPPLTHYGVCVRVCVRARVHVLVCCILVCGYCCMLSGMFITIATISIASIAACIYSPHVQCQQIYQMSQWTFLYSLLNKWEANGISLRMPLEWDNWPRFLLSRLSWPTQNASLFSRHGLNRAWRSLGRIS